MALVKVPVYGAPLKAVNFDPKAGERAEAAVAALAAQISAGTGSTIFHRNLRNLQVGDDHPQYTMWQAPETIQATWNFAAEPEIEGVPLTEFIQDVVGDELVQDSTSISWTYGDTANTLQAHIIDEYVQDLVGAMLADSTTIDFTYSDLAGTFTAAVIQSANYNWTGLHTFSQNIVNTFAGSSATPNFLVENAAPNYGWYETDAATGNRRWDIRASSEQFLFRALSDDGSTSQTFLFVNRTLNVIDQISWTAADSMFSGNVRAVTDNGEVTAGAGNDLRLFHDGTDSWVRNDTGILKLSQGANVTLQFNSSRAWGVDGANYGTSGQVLTSNGSSAAPSWQTSAGGSAVVVNQASTLTITSNNSFQTTSLTTTLAAGVYSVQAHIWCDAHATPDMEIQFQYTGSVTNLNGRRTAFRITTPVTSEDVTVNLADTVYNMNDTSRFYVEYAFMVEVSTSGTFAVYARQVTSSGTAVAFLAGSTMTLIKTA